MSLDKHEHDILQRVIEELGKIGVAIANGNVTKETGTQINNFIDKLDGNIIQEPIKRKEINVHGDKFENIKNSVIATRGSIAQGVIGVREQHGDDIADALQTLEATLTGEFAQEMSDDDRQKALELLSEISQQGAKPEPSKPVLQALGETFWGLVEKVEPLSKACLVAWKIVEKFWL